jgi:hypothetical protein
VDANRLGVVQPPDAAVIAIQVLASAVPRSLRWYHSFQLGAMLSNVLPPNVSY